MAESNGTGDRRPWRRRLSWEALSATVAVLSLVAALIFNGLQTRQASEATQLQLLTELNSQLSESFRDLDRHELEVIQLRTGEREYLTLAARRDVDRAFAYMEYLSWLANGRYLTLPEAHALWGEDIACAYEHVLVPSRDPRRQTRLGEDYPHLTEFVVRFTPCDR